MFENLPIILLVSPKNLEFKEAHLEFKEVPVIVCNILD